jgi:serine/threonine protein kinase
VVELIDGRPLSAIVAAGALAPRRALVLVRQLLDALEHAHGRGVVHRDLKPDNLLVTLAGAAADPFERLKVLDFGLVKLLDDAAAIVGGERLTRTGIAFGTPAYMAPEAALGRALDRRVDLYAVGVILFELLTGALPVCRRRRAHAPAPARRGAAAAAGRAGRRGPVVHAGPRGPGRGRAGQAAR